MKIVPALLVLLSSWGAATAQTLVKINQAEINQILRQLAGITGFKIRHPVACDLISKEKVNEFLHQRVKEVTTPEDLRAEELTLKKFGLVPQDFNLAQATVELMTEQAAAFYDYHGKKLYITDSTPSAMRQPALVHELAHALADQNFGLEHFIRQSRKNDDSSVARLAVMEGQASWLMTEYMARRMGRSLKDSPEALKSFVNTMQATPESFPVFENAPLYMRETLVFPYTQGLIFQQAVFERMGKAGFSVVFRGPPSSTAQVLHPAKYFDRESPSNPKLPPVKLGRGYKTLITGSMGELDHAILLRLYADGQQAETVSPHWRGGSYALHENRSKKSLVLAYASEWEDASAAAEFFRLYHQVLQKKWKRMEVAADQADTFAGRGDDGHFVVRLDGVLVTSVEGLRSLKQGAFAALR